MSEKKGSGEARAWPHYGWCLAVTLALGSVVMYGARDSAVLVKFGDKFTESLCSNLRPDEQAAASEAAVSSDEAEDEDEVNDAVVQVL